VAVRARRPARGHLGSGVIGNPCADARHPGPGGRQCRRAAAYSSPCLLPIIWMSRSAPPRPESARCTDP
jgi:hypothetical protein